MLIASTQWKGVFVRNVPLFVIQNLLPKWLFIRNNDDTILLQNDLNKIAEWEFMWQMQFNIDKCFILRVGRPKHKLVHLYTLHNQNLSETDSAKYLGLTITSDLQWNQHINNITNKANSILGLLRRNLRIPSQTIKHMPTNH